MYSLDSAMMSDASPPTSAPVCPTQILFLVLHGGEWLTVTALVCWILWIPIISLINFMPLSLEFRFHSFLQIVAYFAVETLTTFL